MSESGRFCPHYWRLLRLPGHWLVGGRREYDVITAPKRSHSLVSTVSMCFFADDAVVTSAAGTSQTIWILVQLSGFGSTSWSWGLWSWFIIAGRKGEDDCSLSRGPRLPAANDCQTEKWEGPNRSTLSVWKPIKQTLGAASTSWTVNVKKKQKLKTRKWRFLGSHGPTKVLTLVLLDAHLGPPSVKEQRETQRVRIWHSWKEDARLLEQYGCSRNYTKRTEHTHTGGVGGGYI